MDMSQAPVVSPAPKRIGDRAFDGLAVTLVFLAYFVVFLIVRRDSGLSDAALSSLINLVPLVLMTGAIRAVIRTRLIGRGPLRQVIGHAALAAIFAFAWHWMLMVLVGIRTGGSFTDFAVRAFFPTPVFAWQLLQGVTIYALLAALTYVRTPGDLPSFLAAVPEGNQDKDGALARFFIRRGDDILPIDTSQIISIQGADDYAEVSTLEGRHLVRTSLAEFEATLDAATFLRVHRSHIVNLHRIVRAEPSGDGRILLHMENGDTVQTSRAGAKLMRGRVI